MPLSKNYELGTLANTLDIDQSTGEITSLTIDTDVVSEGANLYFTSERVDDRVAALIQAGTNITVAYDDVLGTLTISASDTEDDLSNNTTSDLAEGTNLYYTNARADARIATASIDALTDVDITTAAPSSGQSLVWDNVNSKFIPGDSFSQSDFDTAFAAKSTTDLSEGTNLYYTDARADARIAAADTDALSEGSTNLYFTNARADARIAAATTTDLTEGTNLYYTDARADARAQLKIDSLVDSAPNTLDTLNELAAALGDDANFSTTITNSIATKLATADFNSTFDTRLGTKTTADLTEGTNLYYTDARADARIAAADTDDLSEGSTNLYFTNARADARIALQAGANLDLSSKSTSDLSEGTNLYYTNARVDAHLNQSNPTSGYVLSWNGSDYAWIDNTGYTAFNTDFDTRLGTKTTANLTEGSNLYYTNARADARVDAGFTAKSTSDLSEGTNLYYTNARADARIALQVGSNLDLSSKDTNSLSEGSNNLYYTNARVDARVNLQTGSNLNLSSKDTDALSEGSNNLYFTNARVQGTAINAGSLRGSVNNATVQYGTSYSGTPAQGSFFFDSLNAKLKVYNGSAFVDAVPAGSGGGGGGGASDAVATFRKYTFDISSTTNSVSGKDNVVLTAGNFVTGYQYEIISVGNTDFTAIGASGNTVGVTFTATGAGSGTGTAGHILNYATSNQNVEVYRNGAKMVEGSSDDYVATTGTSVNFTYNLQSGDVVEVQVYELLTSDAYYLKTETYTQTETNTQISTAVAGIVDSAPTTLDTLNELAAALGDDANFSTTVTNSIATKLPLAGGTLTGGLNVTSGNGNQLGLNNAGERFTQISLQHSGTQNGALWLDDTDSMVDLYANAGHGIRLKTGGDNPRVTILSAGNVGIGNTDPNLPLTVTSNGGANAIAIRARTNDDYGFMQFYNNAGTALRGQIYNHNGAMAISTSTTGTARLYIDTSGNVGIGTTSPATRLNVRAATNHTNGTDRTDLVALHQGISAWQVGRGAGIRWVGDVSRTMAGISAYVFGVEQTGLAFETGGATSTGNLKPTTRMVIDHNGNVGIGETTPAGKLEVQNTSVNYAILGTSNKGHYFESQSDDNTDGFEIYQQHGSTATRNSFIINDNRTGSKSAAFVVRGDGNVGVGAAGPEVKLEVNGGADGSVVFAGRSDGGNGNNRRFNLIAYADGGGANYGGGLKIQTRDSVNVFHDRITVQSNGNFGIGTSTPDTILEIVSSNPILTLRDTSTGFNNGDATLRLAESGTGDVLGGYFDVRLDASMLKFDFTPEGGSASTYMAINSSDGNVGIGTATPSTFLDVKGAVNSDGIIKAESTSGDAYTQNNFNNAPIITVKSPNAVDNYSGIRYTNSVGNYEWYAGTHQYASQAADYVFQGYHRSGSAYKEKMRIREDGSIRRKFSYHTSWNGSSVLIANLIGINGFSSTNCRGEISIMASENNLNASFAKYMFVVSYYSPNGNFYVNLTQTGRAKVNNSFGDGFVHLTSQQYNSTNQTYSTGSNAAANIYARTGGSYGTLKIMIDFYDHN